jgi:hypothetical protein
VAVIAGCGNDAPERADVAAVATPAGATERAIPRVGMTFTAPENWGFQEREAPGAFALFSGSAAVSGFAYRRREPLPRSRTELEEARTRLVEEVLERDPDFDLEKAEETRHARRPAVEIVGTQVLSRRKVRTRSVHIYAGRVEYVLEALAPPEDFETVSRRVLDPLLESLRVTGRVEQQ